LGFSDIEGAHYGAWPLGHGRLAMTAIYTRVVTNVIARTSSPLDRLHLSVTPPA
jgi:hypothetical protein